MKHALRLSMIEKLFEHSLYYILIFPTVSNKILYIVHRKIFTNNTI